MKLYTIGTSDRSAESFFGNLHSHGVRRVIDTRLRPSGGLKGYAQKRDLPFLLKHVNIGYPYNKATEYSHIERAAPTAEMLDAYRADADWDKFASAYQDLMREREIERHVYRHLLEDAVLLCSERSYRKCHRRLLAEHLQGVWDDLEVTHL